MPTEREPAKPVRLAADQAAGATSSETMPLQRMPSTAPGLRRIGQRRTRPGSTEPNSILLHVSVSCRLALATGYDPLPGPSKTVCHCRCSHPNTGGHSVTKAHRLGRRSFTGIPHPEDPTTWHAEDSGMSSTIIVEARRREISRRRIRVLISLASCATIDIRNRPDRSENPQSSSRWTRSITTAAVRARTTAVTRGPQRFAIASALMTWLHRIIRAVANRRDSAPRRSSTTVPHRRLGQGGRFNVTQRQGLRHRRDFTHQAALPMPAGPTTPTTAPWPSIARSNKSVTANISHRRPTRFDSARLTVRSSRMPSRRQPERLHQHP